MKSTRLAYLTVLTVAACACTSPPPTVAPTPTVTMGPTATATTAAHTQLELVPFTVGEWGIRGLAPAEWDQAEPGHFLPAETGAGRLRLVYEFYPGLTLAQLIESSLQPGLGLDEWPAPVSGHPSSRLPWQLYAIEMTLRSCPNTTMDLALAESAVGCYVILLLSPNEQRDALRQSIFVPAVGALEVIPTEDTDHYYHDSLALFDYDASAPLDIQELEVWPTGGVVRHEIHYASPAGGRVPASLIVPEGDGPFAGIILMHGMPGNRSMMRSTGERYARAGAVVLAIDAPHARPEHAERCEWAICYSELDREEQIQLIVDLRRAVDLLIARPDVASNRLAYVGVSYGGAMGGLFAGVEDRLQAYVLVVGDGGLVNHETGLDDLFGDLYSLPQSTRKAWLDSMWPIEPLHFVAHAAPSVLLFQSGRQDELVPFPDAVRYQVAASELKEVLWYDAGHSLGTDAQRDQGLWLAQYIGLDVDAFR